jgi:hypothetical protein
MWQILAINHRIYSILRNQYGKPINLPASKTMSGRRFFLATLPS